MRQPTSLLLAALLTACQPEATPPRPLPAAAVRPALPLPVVEPNFPAPTGEAVAEPVVNLPPSEGVVIQQTSNGYSHCELIEGGDVQCWGRNRYGQLGDGTLNERGTPRVILRGAVQLAMHKLTSCALLRSGEVYCWGARNGVEAELLPGTVTTYGHSSERYLQSVRLRPTRIEGLPPTRLITHTAWQTCALTTGGEVYCWGVDPEHINREPSSALLLIASRGCLGAHLGTEEDYCDHLQVSFGLADVISHTAQRLEALSGSDALWGGESQHCARSRAGQVRCWGHRVRAPGVAPSVMHSQPVRVPPLDGAQQLASYKYGPLCALRAGALTCWDGDDPLTVPAALAAEPVKDIASSHRDQLYALTSSGRVLTLKHSAFESIISYADLLADIEHINSPSTATLCVTKRDGQSYCHKPYQHPANMERTKKGWCGTTTQIAE